MANRRLRTAQRNATAAKTSARVSENITESGTWQTPSAKEAILSQRGTTGTSGLKPNAGMQDVSSQIVPGTNFTYADIGIHSIPITPDTSQAGRLAQLEGAKNLSGIQTPSQVTINTRPEAGAPLQSPLSGVKGAGTGLGFNPAGTVADVNGQIKVQTPVGVPLSPEAAPAITRDTKLGDRALIQASKAVEASDAAIKTEKIKQSQIQQEQEKSRIADEAMSQGVSPEQVGGNAALANLAKSSPEAQALLPYLEQFQNDIAAQITKNTEFVEGRLGETIDTFDSVDKKIEDMKSEYKTSTEMLNDFLKEAKDDTDKALALQQESLNNQLMWQQATERGKVMRQKAAQHDALVVQLALEGGFGQPAALKGVMETDAKFDQNLQELATFYGYKRVDLAAKFSGLYAENHQNYIKNTSDNLKEMRGAIERITTLGIQNKKDRQTEIDSIMEKGFERQDKYITEKSKATLDAANKIVSIIQAEKTEKRQKEQDSLDMIQYLSENYDPSDVADAIKELSKNVKSFDASSLAGLSSLDVKKKLKSSVGGAGGMFSGFLPQPQENKVMSFDEFIASKIDMRELDLSQSLSPDEREKYKLENMDLFKSEYARSIAPSYDSMPSSGNSTVDEIAKGFLDGTITNTRLSSKEARVSEVVVLNQIRNLREHGYTPQFPILTSEQGKVFGQIDNARRKDPIYKKAADAISGYSNIISQSKLGTGASQIAVINTFQGQLVDPGATVRAEDIALMKTATAFLDSIEPKFILNKIAKGQLVPQSLIDQIVQSSENIVAMRVRNYNEITLPEFQKQAKLRGLPDTVFEPFSKNSISNVSVEVSESSFDYDEMLRDEGLIE